MLDLPGIGSRFLLALLMVSCSSEDTSKSEDGSDGANNATTTSTATSGMGAGNATANTSGPSNSTVSTSAGPANTSVGGDSGGSGGSGGTGDGPSTTGGQGNFGMFGFGAGGTSDAGGTSSAGGSSGDGGSGGTTSAAATANSGVTTGAGGCTPAVECEPEPLPSTGDAHQDCVDRVNQFRVGCWCLPALERWTEGEDCADEHAQYDSEQGAMGTAHAGFRDGICENGGNGQNECPGWGSETQVIEGCLQMMYDEGPPPSDPCNDQCFQDHGHFINMTNENYSRVACGFYTTPDGDVWAVQNFR